MNLIFPKLNDNYSELKEKIKNKFANTKDKVDEDDDKQVIKFIEDFLKKSN